MKTNWRALYNWRYARKGGARYIRVPCPCGESLLIDTLWIEKDTNRTRPVCPKCGRQYDVRLEVRVRKAKEAEGE